MYRILITAFALAFLLNPNVASADSTSDAKPKSKRTALTRSLIWTLVPVAVGGAMMLHGQRISPIGFSQSNGQTDDIETLAGLAIGSAGIVLGPGAGHSYARKMGRFWGGVAIRGAAAALTVVLAPSSSSGSSSLSSLDDQIMQVVIAFVVGGTICLGSAIYDIATVGTSVDGYNDEHSLRSLTLRPTYFASHKAPGVMLTLSF
jgi:hypothetical protein